MSQPHESLVAWQRADELCVTIYRLTGERFPKDERYGLTAQLRRAAYSVAANIAEGYADSSKGWRVRYIRIAIGSLAEVGYGLHLARRLKYIDAASHEQVAIATRKTAAPLHGLMAHLREKRDH